MLEAAAFLLPTMTSCFFDGPAFISPFPPSIKANSYSIENENMHMLTATNKKPILDFRFFRFKLICAQVTQFESTLQPDRAKRW